MASAIARKKATPWTIFRRAREEFINRGGQPCLRFAVAISSIPRSVAAPRGPLQDCQIFREFAPIGNAGSDPGNSVQSHAARLSLRCQGYHPAADPCPIHKTYCYFVDRVPWPAADELLPISGPRIPTDSGRAGIAPPDCLACVRSRVCTR